MLPKWPHYFMSTQSMFVNLPAWLNSFSCKCTIVFMKQHIAALFPVVFFHFRRSCFEGCQDYVDDGKEARDPVDKLLRIIIKMRGNEQRG